MPSNNLRNKEMVIYTNIWDSAKHNTETNVRNNLLF
jgi:hypothetical protein